MYILDTDFIFYYFDEIDSNHQKDRDLVEKFGSQNTVISNLAKQELATVISGRFGHYLANEIVKNVSLFEPQNVFSIALK